MSEILQSLLSIMDPTPNEFQEWVCAYAQLLVLYMLRCQRHKSHRLVRTKQIHLLSVTYRLMLIVCYVYIRLFLAQQETLDQLLKCICQLCPHRERCSRRWASWVNNSWFLLRWGTNCPFYRFRPEYLLREWEVVVKVYDQVSIDETFSATG